MKKCIAFILLVTTSIAFLFSGCEKNGVSKQKQTESIKGIRTLSGNEGGICCGNKYCYNEDGLYFVKEHQIMYIDFATRQQVYLCNNTGCNHITDECTAVLSDAEFTFFSRLFFHNGFLYVLSKDNDEEGMLISNGDSTGENEFDYEIPAKRAELFRMNPDGTNRKKVYEFDENVIVEDIVLGDEESLYFVTKRMKTKNSGNSTYYAASEKYLTKINISTWESEVAYELKTEEIDTEWKVIGGFDNSVVLERTAYAHERSLEERAEELSDEALRTKNYLESNEEIAVVDLKDKSLKIVYSDSNDSGEEYYVFHSFAQKDGILYAAYERGDEIQRINLKTGEKDVLTELKDSYITAAYGNVLQCSAPLLEEEESWETYYVNVDDGTVKTNHLKNSLTNSSIEILAEIEEYFFVRYNEGESNGVNSWTIEKDKYGLISKEDFYNDKPNYIYITEDDIGW